MSLSTYEVRVLDLLADGPLTAPELRRRLDLQSDGWLYGLLCGLEAGGVIRATRVRLRGRGNGSGRGAKVYELIGAPARQGDDLARIAASRAGGRR